ncbi:hypothetical protein DD592_26405 [Enterobacter cloacae complex sp. 2DZ2F20B]|nr:hypothetical protein DD592_26405 [Enterobacter cloacae complex sp. 2DZ2F20B]
MHPDIIIQDNRKKLLDTIAYCNFTKYGDDMVDQVARKNSFIAGSRTSYFNILDLAVINAWILYHEVIKKEISGRKFLLKLRKELAASDVGSGQVKLIKMTYC